MIELADFDCGVLVLGGGVAALRAALAAREAGVRVVLAAKGIIGRGGASPISSGGMAGFLPAAATDDSAAAFCQDLLDSGHGLSDPALVAAVVADSGPCLEELARYGIRFLMAGDHWFRGRASGHSHARCFRADPLGHGAQGLGITLPLRAAAATAGVVCLDQTAAVQLLVGAEGVSGALLVDRRRQRLLTVTAGAVVLATGGCGGLYATSTCPRDLVGAGLAMALRAGATLRDMEFMQFNPNRMERPVRMQVPDTLLAAGAVLRDRHGRDFMRDYHPSGSLAPRDIKSRAIFLEVQNGNGVDGGVYLDCSAVPAAGMALRHTHLQALFRGKGIDFPRKWLVVSAAAHFHMGGVAVDANGCTGVPGLCAAGEAAGGMHGGNRLASTALTEAVVMGRRAGQAAAAQSRTHAGRADSTAPAFPAWLGNACPAAPGQLPRLWQELRQLMWARVGICRDGPGLDAAVDGLVALQAEAAPLQAETPAAAAELQELADALTTAEIMARAALLRAETRGAHFRADFPGTRADWQQSIWVRRANGEVTFHRGGGAGQAAE